MPDSVNILEELKAKIHKSNAHCFSHCPHWIKESGECFFYGKVEADPANCFIFLDRTLREYRFS